MSRTFGKSLARRPWISVPGRLISWGPTLSHYPCCTPTASRVRLAAGRKQLSPEAVTLCFLAGANSIFVGEKLLTTPNPGPDEDEQLLMTLGLKPLESHAI